MLNLFRINQYNLIFNKFVKYKYNLLINNYYSNFSYISLKNRIIIPLFFILLV